MGSCVNRQDMFKELAYFPGPLFLFVVVQNEVVVWIIRGFLFFIIGKNGVLFRRCVLPFALT